MPSKQKNKTRAIRKSSSSRKKEQVGRSWFFGIGINEYIHFPDLNNAVRDVESLLGLLKEKYELDNDVTLFNKKATRRNIIRNLDLLIKKIKPADKLIIYYSGHGHLTENERGFWVPHEAESGFTDDFVSNARLKEYMQDIKARHILLLSDACFSGSLFAKGGKKNLPRPEEVLERNISRYAFCSGRKNEEVHDGPPEGHSPFSDSLLKLLKENQQAKLRMSMLAEEVMNITASKYRQLPLHGTLFDVGDDGGQYIFNIKQNEEVIWEACQKENTIASFSHYLDQFPKGKYAGSSLVRIKEIEDDQDWEKALSNDRIYAYRDYLTRWDKGRHIEEAAMQIKRLLVEKEAVEQSLRVKDTWQKIEQEDNIASYELFLEEFPESNFTTKAESRIKYLQKLERQVEQQKQEEKEWEKTKKENTVEAYQDYLSNFPKGKFAVEVNKRMLDLRRQKEAEVNDFTEKLWGEAEEAMKKRKENFFWNTAQEQNIKSSYESYLHRYPTGRYAEKANEQIKMLLAKEETEQQFQKDKETPQDAEKKFTPRQRAAIFGIIAWAIAFLICGIIFWAITTPPHKMAIADAIGAVIGGAFWGAIGGAIWGVGTLPTYPIRENTLIFKLHKWGISNAIGGAIMGCFGALMLPPNYNIMTSFCMIIGIILGVSIGIIRRKKYGAIGTY